MENVEREPRPKESYVDIFNNLRYDEGLLLGRDHVRYVRADGTSGTVPVHYEDLNSEMKPRRLPIGRQVTKEFVETARQLSKESRFVKMSPVYPVLSVINYSTELSESKVIDVAQLIADGELEVYSLPTRTDPEGEMLSLDFTELIEDMVQEMGSAPNEVLVVGRNKAMALRDVNIVNYTFVGKTHSFSEEVEPITLPHRGTAVLNMLQMSSAKKLITSGYRVVERTSAGAEISFHIIKKPDMQGTMLSLIKLVESRQYSLYCRKDLKANGDTHAILSIFDGEKETWLAEDSSLDVAVYNAYSTARELFPRARH